MLIFETWPPEVGRVDWKSGASEAFLPDGFDTYPTQVAQTEYHEFWAKSQFIGSLLAANMNTATSEELMSNACEIANYLSRGWNLQAQGEFMDAVQSGVLMEVQHV